MNKRARIGRIVAAAAATVGLVFGGMLFADAAYAATTVSITPLTTTVNSGIPVTYTLNISCSGTAGGCGTSTVSFPTAGGALTGDSPTIDFASWVNAGTCPALTKTGGVATFDVTSFIGTQNASQQCTFTVTPPEFKTLNGAVATITPTLTTANSGSTTGAAVTLTSNATRNAGFAPNASSQVVGGGGMSYSLFFKCAAAAAKTGDIGVNQITMTAQLPANFTYTGFSGGSGTATVTAPAVNAQGGTFTYTSNGSECAVPPLSGTATGIAVVINGTATSASGSDQNGDVVTATTSATWTYIDGTPGSAPPTQVSTNVIVLDTAATKASSTTNPLGNGGQYTFGSTTPVYTFPGDWDGTKNNAEWDIALNTAPTAVVNGGVSYGVQEPMPCLGSGPSAQKYYESPAPGAGCTNPAFVPTVVTTTGFTPAANAPITLRYATGGTATVNYSGGKWTIPTSPAVAEIDFPPFAEQGTNSAKVIHYLIDGYAAGAALPGNELRNTATVTSYLASDLTTPLASVSVKTPKAVIYIADPATVNLYVNVTPGTVTSCTTAYAPGNTASRQTLVQFAQGTSQAISYDLLLPPGATYTGTATTFRLSGLGRTYTTSTPITPQQDADYNGTGRVRLTWTIPAGLATIPGTYQLGIVSGGISVKLPAGCSGRYQTDVTLGYGGPATPMCLSPAGAPASPAPSVPAGSGLSANGVGNDNYCGFSAAVVVNPINPGFSVDKSVKGDLDSATVAGGGTGKVSPNGGTATYTVTFKNSGQSNLHDPVMYDVLPRSGDARGSVFDVQLSSVPAPPAGVTIEYSTAANPCRPEVLPTNPGCAANAFSTTTPSPLSNTTALRISYDGTVGVTGSPFPQTFSVPFTVTTPTVTNGQTAWNTVASNVHTGDTGDPAATDDLLAPATSAKTGLTASNGVPQIVKSSSTPSYSAAGNTIAYSFTVTNNAGATLTNITVVDAFTDAPAGATPPVVTCPVTTLAPAASTTCTAIYTVTQDDIDNGGLSDVATATGTSSGGGTISNTSNGVTVPAVVSPAITMSKSASPTLVTSAGSTIAYSFLVKNTGNQTVHGLTVADPKLGAASVSCPLSTLAPDATTTCTASYVVTQADMDGGSITNTATATALDPTGAARTSTSTAVVTAPAAAHLTLTKSAAPTSVGAVGDVITYGFHVVNDGTVTLTGIAVDDPMLAGVNCPIADLAPGDVEDCTGSYTVQQPDLDAGTITNTAIANGTSPAGADIPSAPSSAAVTVAQHAVLTLTETVDLAKATAAGQVLHYTFHVVNAGNVTITGVAVQETGFTGTGGAPTVSCPATSLAPGDDMDCTASYTVVAADLALASIDNPASVTGVTTNGSLPPVTSTTQVIVDPPASPLPPAVTAAVLAATGVANVVTGIVSAIGLLGLGLALLILRRRHRDA